MILNKNIQKFYKSVQLAIYLATQRTDLLVKTEVLIYNKFGTGFWQEKHVLSIRMFYFHKGPDHNSMNWYCWN